MALLLDVEWEECFLEPTPDPEFQRWARSQTGRSPGNQYFTSCPWLAHATVELTLLPLVHLDHDEADLVALVVSRDNSCRLCYAGARSLLRLAGMRPKRIDRLEEGLLSAEQQTRTQRAMDFARRLSRFNPPPNKADYQALRETGYTEGQIKEIAYVAADYVIINRLTTFTALPVRDFERLADDWRLSVARYFLQGILNKRRRPAESEFLTDELKRGPFAACLAGLDGLPTARKLLEILNAAWDSPLLTRRAKALAFAVVARGLQSRRCEQEAFRLLAEQGLEADQVEDILAHLGSPALDEAETTIVRFARETTWYQPAPIQRRAREVHEQLGAAAFLELVGITSLANAIARLASRPDLV
jgi:AhpD family alkylhydroperoxidase